MDTFYACACFFSFLTTLYAAEPAESGCLQREKGLALLETAEDLLWKAEDSYPSCKEESNSTDQSECSGKKSLAYIEITKKLISDARENFPTCIGSKDIVPDDKVPDVKEPDVKEPDVKEPDVKEPEVKQRDCSEIFASGRKQSGVYTIWLSESDTTGKPLQVYCDMKTDNVGWTLIQRRGKYPIQQDFYLDWENYKNGFGNISEEFWLGNENIRVFCHKGCKIRFDIQGPNQERRFAVYENFHLSESDYTINISGFTGDAGDGMYYHNKNAFNTKDKGNIEMAKRDQSGWWSGNYYQSNLNGIYQPGGFSIQNVYWSPSMNYYNLATAEIKVRPY